MAELIETYACSPTTERGRGILISGDAKSDTILYTNARSVVIRSLSNPLQTSVYGDHSHPVTVARFSPNGEWVASADVSGVVRVWGTRGDRALKNEFRPLSGRIDDLQWSPDGQRIVVSGDGRGKSFVRAFMWDTGTTIGEFDGHSRRVLSCAFKPTRPFRIVTCGEDFLVNFYEGPPFKFKHSSREHSNFVNCVRFSPDGSKFITVSSDKKGLIYDGKTGEKIGELSNENGHTGTIYALSWSPDGKNVLTVSADKTAKIWEISEDGSGKVTKTLTPPGIGGFEDMLIGCLWQNTKLLTISLGGLFNLYPEPDKDPITFSGHMKSVSSLCCVSGEESGIEIPVLTASYDGVIVRWILGSGFESRVLRKENSQIKCFLASDGEIITSSYDNKVWRIPLNGNSCGNSEFIDIGSQAQSISLSPSQNLLLIGSDSSLSLLQNFKPLSSSKLGFQITALAISPDGIEAVVGGQDGKLRVYSIKDGILEEEGVIEKHRGSITVVKYSPDGTMFATADTNREAVVWDRATREVKLKNMLYHTARINCVAWSGNSKFIATGSLDTSVIIYELERNASQRVTIKGAHLGGVYGLSFVGEDRIVSAGEDACVRVWKLGTE